VGPPGRDRQSVRGPDPAQRARLVKVIDNLNGRIAGAGREGRLGEVEELQVSRAGAEAKFAQINQRTNVALGTPDLSRLTGRMVTTSRPQPGQPSARQFT
jgi:hypothetical protein